MVIDLDQRVSNPAPKTYWTHPSPLHTHSASPFSSHCLFFYSFLGLLTTLSASWFMCNAVVCEFVRRLVIILSRLRNYPSSYFPLLCSLCCLANLMVAPQANWAAPKTKERHKAQLQRQALNSIKRKSVRKSHALNTHCTKRTHTPVHIQTGTHSRTPTCRQKRPAAGKQC